VLSERYHLKGLPVSEVQKRLKEEEERVRREIQKELKIKEGVEKMRRAAPERKSVKTHMSAEIKKSVSRLDSLNEELNDLRTYQLMTEDGSTTFSLPAKSPGSSLKLR
jgi:Hr1 repeat